MAAPGVVHILMPRIAGDEPVLARQSGWSRFAPRSNMPTVTPRPVPPLSCAAVALTASRPAWRSYSSWNSDWVTPAGGGRGSGGRTGIAAGGPVPGLAAAGPVPEGRLVLRCPGRGVLPYRRRRLLRCRRRHRRPQPASRREAETNRQAAMMRNMMEAALSFGNPAARAAANIPRVRCGSHPPGTGPAARLEPQCGCTGGRRPIAPWRTGGRPGYSAAAWDTHTA